MNRRLFLGVGVAVWLLATLLFRLFGQRFFLYDERLLMLALWLVTAAAMIALALALFRWQGLRRAQRWEAAALLVLAGMLLDALVVANFAAVFPNMPVAAAGSFGAWLLWAYATVLLAAFLPIGDAG